MRPDAEALGSQRLVHDFENLWVEATAAPIQGAAAGFQAAFGAALITSSPTCGSYWAKLSANMRTSSAAWRS